MLAIKHLECPSIAGNANVYVQRGSVRDRYLRVEYLSDVVIYRVVVVVLSTCLHAKPLFLLLLMDSNFSSRIHW